MYVPCSGAGQLPPVDPSYCAALRGLRLGGRTRPIAGLVYEHQSVDDQRRVVEMVEAAYRAPGDVSAALGLEKRVDLPFGDGARWIEVVPAGADMSRRVRGDPRATARAGGAARRDVSVPSVFRPGAS